MKQLYQNFSLWGYKSILRFLVVGLLLFLQHFTATAQCPPNIDFEQGNFSGWECWVGTHSILPSGKDTINFGTTPVPPDPLRHVMYSSVPGDGIDPYGKFPVNCPNGSGHSIKVGNEGVGVPKAQGVSYTFTIPAGQNKFTLIYYYAVVLHLPPHPDVQKPKLVITIENLTDGTPLPCPLDPFIPGNGIPGFFDSPINPDVKCKNWAAASINLDGYAGKTIRIFFKTANCTPNGHFGYAYIDVSSQCSSSFVGATFCPDDTSVNITAPAGYQNYTWYDGLMTQVIGTGQTLTLNPPPLAGDSVKVELIPFNGYGCTNVLTAQLWDTLTVAANAGPDKSTCDNKPVQLGAPPVPGRVYKWMPVTGLSDPNIANPLASPSVTTLYTLTVTNSGGGCLIQDIVNVKVDILSDSLQLIGPASHCTNTGETVVLKVLPHDSIQWYKNGLPIPGPLGVNQTQYTVIQSGDYYAMVFSATGCNRTTAVKKIDIWESPVVGFNTNNMVQCNAGNQFIFTNTSTLNTGVLQYAWDLGDGSTFSTRDINHTYLKDGKYTVKLLITAPGGCADSTSVDVQVNPSPTSAFTIDMAEQCFKNNLFVFKTKSTVTSGILAYTWDFGDGNFDNPGDISHHYAQPGTYLVKLTAVETAGGCSDDSTFPVIVHQSPVPAFSINTPAIQCFPGNQFVFTDGTSILSDTLLYVWSMGDGINKTSKDVTYSYAQPGNYNVKLVVNTLFGCKDSLVKIILIHAVPTADFSIRPICENLEVPIINRTFNNSNSTVNYLWDFGDGHLDNVKSPVYAYPSPGTYTVSLSVSTAQCPLTPNTKSVDVTIEDQLPGIMYPDKDAAFNFNEPLRARQIGRDYIWTPPTDLSNRFSASPVYRGITPQLYTVQITTALGCVTVDTQYVRTHKKIGIYVPTGFTPNGDGNNERLRPVTVGFTKVNYFRVYDRWGKLLFSMNGDQPGWDGTVNGKPVGIQTVIWMVEGVDVDGKVQHKQGTTVVIK